MKKMVKIVLITVLVALPALGTYVKTTLPTVGSAPDLAMEKTAERIDAGKCHEGRLAVSINCNNDGNWSEFADPITGGMPNLSSKSGQDFPINFLFNAIPVEAEISVQHDVTMEKVNQKYRISDIL